MKRLALTAAALLLLTEAANLATAEYLFIKIDIEAALQKLAEHGGGGKLDFDASKFQPKKGGLAPAEAPVASSGNWIYGIIEYRNDDKKTELHEVVAGKEDPKKGAINPKKSPPFDPKKGFDKNKMGMPMPPVQDKAGKLQDREGVLSHYVDLDLKSSRLIIPIVLGWIEKEANIQESNIVWGLGKGRSLKDDFEQKRKNERGEAELLDLAFWALKRGLIREFHDTMKELGRVAPENKAFRRYSAVKEDMDKKPGEPPFSDDLKAELKSFKSKKSKQGHYIIYWKGDEPEAQLDRRLDRFESTYVNYFYWWALQETLPAPALPKHLLAVQLEPLTEFNKRFREASHSQELPSGITVRRENLVVLASSPNLPAYQKLKSNIDAVRKGKWSAEDLLSGAVWLDEKKYKESWITTDDQKRLPRSDLAGLQTLVVLLKQMADDVEWMTISREGTRQLLGASEFLSRNVNAPEWIQAGMLNYFEIAPAYKQLSYLHQGFGLPRADYLRPFKVPMKDEQQYANVLFDLGADKFFRAKGDQSMGQAAAWGLIFYLANDRKLEYVANYARELNKLPRHMTFPKETLDNCFKLSFHINDPRDARRIDATTWFNKLGSISAQSSELERFFAAPKARAAP